MNNPFSPGATRPNLALRKPWLTPDGSGGSPPMQVADTANGRPNSPIGVTPTLSNSSPQSPKVHYCIFCGQEGKFRCKRCKNTSYCSVECQGEDWAVHSHICKPADQEPAKVKPMEAPGSLVLEERSSLPDLQPGDESRPQRIFMKDLPVAKVINGTDIQAKVEEFYNPGRFFLLAHNLDVMKALQIISTELQNTYRFQPATPYVPCVGEVCAVQYSCDMNWYRGLVQMLAAEQKMANILYIDFGNEECVPLDRIKQLTTKIQPYCPCVMECHIAKVVPVGGNWPAECCMAVRQLLAGRIISVHLVETLENGRIHAVDIQLSTGKLSTFLIANGYATENKINVTPAEQEIHEMMNASFENFKRLSDGKDDNSWAQPPEPLTQVVGDSFSVVVTHLQSPSDFIVQKVDNARVIQELQFQLWEHCYQATAPENFRPAPGTVCCAQFSEDKQWYRAKILAYSSEERACVGYLDFGNSEEVDIGHLRPISSSLLAVPVQTIPCGLAGVQPVGGKWSQECILALQQRISNRILYVEIQGLHEGRALVAMIDKGSDPQGDVAELLTSAGFAAPVAVVTSMNQHADHKPLSEAQVPSASSEALAWRCAELPVDGQAVSLLASVVKDPQEFYCHISNGEDLQQLLKLGAELKKHCAENNSSYVPKVGEPCCAMCPNDQEWHRVMLDGLSDTTVSVIFVDYGYRMKLPKENLRPITPSFLTLPFQAVRCSLAGVEPLGSEWTSEAKQWFRSQVDGELVTARVLSVSERGYELKLEIRERDMAAALISEQLAKAPGAIPEPTCVNPELKHEEKAYESHVHQEQVQIPGQSGSISKEMPTDEATVQSDMQLEFPFFPVDWKTGELPLGETFRPRTVAIISPSLFYVLSPIQVNQQKLQAVMRELANYCSSNKHSLSSLSSSSVSSRAVPGAVCCAQFSADNIWYRAVVLEGGANEVKVIYADYGNTETVPYSRILPIPKHLLQLPFQISRCTLTGKEHFPQVWPVEVQHTFQTLLSKDVLATVESFDGVANVLSLCLVTETDKWQFTALIQDGLQEQARASPDQARASPDQARASQEQARASPEQARASPEQARASPEQARPSQEQARPSQEQAKPSPEQARASPEQARPSQEQARPSQEQAKPSQEQARASPEQARASQEQARANPEQIKPSPEQARPSPEQVRPSPEQTKSHSEQTKPGLEQTKPSPDQARPSQNQTKPSQDQANAYLSLFSQMPAQTNGSAAVVSHSPQPKLMSVTQMGPEEAPTSTCKSISSKPGAWRPKLEKNTTAPPGTVNQIQTIVQIEPSCMTSTKTDLLIPTCCCVSLKTQIDHLEHLLQLQLSLIKQLLQQN